MKLLWITNSPFPEVYEQLNLKAPVNVGWVHSAANALLEEKKDLIFTVASFHEVSELTELKIGSISHYLIPKELKTGFGDTSKDYIWKSLKDKIKPDVVHIHGSEYPHSHAYVRACGGEEVVLSIQGLVSVYERYYYGNISLKNLLTSITVRDLLRLDTVFSQQRNMKKRGYLEQQLIRNVSHIIGRTSWDRDHVWAINPKAKYHFCNETLRPIFYENRWSIEDSEAYRIFVSQAHYPLKGLHQLIKALPLILRHYPQTKVYVAGNNFFSSRGWRINGYGKYINTLIKKLKLEGIIQFAGVLNQEEMSQQFLRAHVFVSPSAIENSPNSVGEAQLLGVPCISSYVGGTSDMVKHQESGLLFRFEEYEMLAARVCQVFENKELAFALSVGGQKEAKKRHDRRTNARELYSIYSDIAKLPEKH
ncbi:glycosyltransferase family 4 protein [Sunxiuqinia elliptica]